MSRVITVVLPIDDDERRSRALAPGLGSVGDYVGFRWGSRVAALYVVPVAGADGHDVVLAAARAVAAASGVP